MDAPEPTPALTPEQYHRAVQLCARVVDAAHSDAGGPTVAGSFLGQLAELLDPVDEKGRGPSYRRGFADGRMAERAGAAEFVRTVEALDALPVGTSVQLWNGHVVVKDGEPDGTDVAYFETGVGDGMGAADVELPALVLDPPPFAPELADAPIITGESGAPAPLVVDQPVHESTLPAELGTGPLRDFPSDGPEDEGTHYPGDGCQPPHPDWARDLGR